MLEYPDKPERSPDKLEAFNAKADDQCSHYQAAHIESTRNNNSGAKKRGRVCPDQVAITYGRGSRSERGGHPDARDSREHSRADHRQSHDAPGVKASQPRRLPGCARGIKPAAEGSVLKQVPQGYGEDDKRIHREGNPKVIRPSYGRESSGDVVDDGCSIG